ncbi:hypothetical protein FVA81_16620 [Rhizobium sp. WL3]|uniref:hypothetical protein n=1 Tax=Rhizobium sp. WL3 TaxID=2603277 RepID=UPI0011C1DA0E|nr:hypothetical protein [Rhizobium sp. WL3]QEE46132.1 hypothetical protein FVA81_16620 [Rhizobium sp. WL3]
MILDGSRAEMIKVYLDNNCWDFLFFHQLDLAVELPADQFEVWLARESEMEIPPLEAKNPELHLFIQLTRKKCNVRTERILGFDEPGLPESERRFGGFENDVRWAAQDEHEYWKTVPIKTSSKRPKTKLYKDEADRALAARSIESVVVTSDAIKSGPLRDARLEGRKVLQLPDKDNIPQGWSLRSAILSVSEGQP